MSFIGTVKEILHINPEGMTPQQIRQEIKAHYPHLYGTETHRRNVEKKHYKDVEHALLAQIYSETRSDKQISIDRSCKPIRLTITPGSDFRAIPEVTTGNRIRNEAKANAKSATRPLAPSPNAISKYLQKWGQLENYRLQESALNLLFRNLCPKNDEIADVLLKVSVLNDFYSTNIFDKYSVAKHILQNNVDERLKKEDQSLVGDIAKISIGGKTKYFYSFASKYCSHHVPRSYPIFDYYVERMLLHYKMCDGFYPFDKSDLKDYKCFIKVIHGFQRFYRLEAYTLREIDTFLWLSGKECYPRRY